ncbi:AAA family ATPase [Corallococcus interemptor]|uniref:AAA family ATPase n=1 Tax=Corallococcus interemptor TaxID=2316720 RepID=UPI003D05F1ED
MTVRSAPWFMLVGGINGAGKSTISQDPETLRSLVKLSDADSIEIINPDTVTRALMAADPSLTQPEANLRAADQCEQDVRSRIEKRRAHFVIETVLASNKYRSIVQRALELEWNILFVYVALPSVEAALARVQIRVANGGHDVPEEKVRKRWPVSLQNLAWFWRSATACMLVHNEDKLSLLASKQQGTTTIFEAPSCPHAVGPVLKATAEACGVVDQPATAQE